MTHGPRLDDALKHETEPLEHSGQEARAQEGRELEDARLPDDPALARRELSRHLDLSTFPADRQRLLAEADENHAPAGVVELLRSLPEDAEFGTIYEVWHALGGALSEREQEVLDRRETA